jgi:hypothetical protein
MGVNLGGKELMCYMLINKKFVHHVGDKKTAITVCIFVSC